MKLLYKFADDKHTTGARSYYANDLLQMLTSELRKEIGRRIRSIVLFGPATSGFKWGVPIRFVIVLRSQVTERDLSCVRKVFCKLKESANLWVVFLIGSVSYVLSVNEVEHLDELCKRRTHISYLQKLGEIWPVTSQYFIRDDINLLNKDDRLIYGKRIDFPNTRWSTENLSDSLERLALCVRALTEWSPQCKSLIKLVRRRNILPTDAHIETATEKELISIINSYVRKKVANHLHIRGHLSGNGKTTLLRQAMEYCESTKLPYCLLHNSKLDEIFEPNAQLRFIQDKVSELGSERAVLFVNEVESVGFPEKVVEFVDSMGYLFVSAGSVGFEKGRSKIREYDIDLQNPFTQKNIFHILSSVREYTKIPQRESPDTVLLRIARITRVPGYAIAIFALSYFDTLWNNLESSSFRISTENVDCWALWCFRWGLYQIKKLFN